LILCHLRRKMIRHQKGQALVEMALIIPLLLVLLLGIFEFGRLFNAYLTVQHATREAARVGVLGASDSEIIALVATRAVTLDPALLSVAVSPSEADRDTGTVMTVTVDYTFQVVMPFISTLLGTGIPIRSALSMRVE